MSKFEVLSKHLSVQYLSITANSLIQAIQFQRNTRIYDGNVVVYKEYGEDDLRHLKIPIFDHIIQFLSVFRR